MDLSTSRHGNDVKGPNVENLKVPFMKDCLNKLPHLTKLTTKSLKNIVRQISTYFFKY